MRVAVAVLWAAARAFAAPTSLELWQSNLDTALVALSDWFVIGLGAGTLPREIFATYVAQDASFLKSFAEAYERAIAKCPADLPRCETDLRGLAAAVQEELTLHAGYAKKWGADLDDGFEPLDATTAYVQFLDQVSAAPESSVAEVIAAMTPCMTLYAAVGHALDSAGAAAEANENPYAEWVETYASDDFQAAAKTIEDLLDVLAARDDVSDANVEDYYALAMQLEYGFFRAQRHAGERFFEAKIEYLLEHGFTFGPSGSRVETVRGGAAGDL